MNTNSTKYLPFLIENRSGGQTSHPFHEVGVIMTPKSDTDSTKKKITDQMDLTDSEAKD